MRVNKMRRRTLGIGVEAPDYTTATLKVDIRGRIIRKCQNMAAELIDGGSDYYDSLHVP